MSGAGVMGGSADVEDVGVFRPESIGDGSLSLLIFSVAGAVAETACMCSLDSVFSSGCTGFGSFWVSGLTSGSVVCSTSVGFSSTLACFSPEISSTTIPVSSVFTGLSLLSSVFFCEISSVGFSCNFVWESTGGSSSFFSGTWESPSGAEGVVEGVVEEEEEGGAGAVLSRSLGT